MQPGSGDGDLLISPGGPARPGCRTGKPATASLSSRSRANISSMMLPSPLVTTRLAPYQTSPAGPRCRRDGYAVRRPPPGDGITGVRPPRRAQKAKNLFFIKTPSSISADHKTQTENADAGGGPSLHRHPLLKNKRSARCALDHGTGPRRANAKILEKCRSPCPGSSRCGAWAGLLACDSLLEDASCPASC